MAAERVASVALAEVMATYRDALRAHEHEINRLNVFPVPDGDTGTNMALTLESVLEELASLGDGASASAVGAAIAKGSLMGARGNSGVILCQVLRGLAGVACRAEELGASELREAIVAAATTARAAVLRPVEGTILSVADAAALAAGNSEESERFDVLLHSVRAAARDALWETPTQLAVLAEAGVVDAGGAGLLLLFDALSHVLVAAPMPEALDLPDAVRRVIAGEGAVLREQHNEESGAEAALNYEVMFLLESDEQEVGRFKDRWAAIGDSIVVVGGEGLWNCHIHTADIGVAIEAGIDAGRPREIRVTDLAHQVEEEAWVRAVPAAGALEGGAAPETSVVAVATGGGVRRIFSSLGVDRLVAGGQSMNPSTAEILEAAEATPGKQVVVLPNNSNIFPVAEQVSRLASKPVFVVPTKGIQEGFAALLAYDPGASAEDNAQLMLEAATQVVAGEVTRAVRPARTAVGTVKAGDWIGLSRQGIEAVGERLSEAALALLEVLIQPGQEIITLIAGHDAPAAELDEIERTLAERHPTLAVERLEGGQPLYPLLVSIE